MLEKKKKRVLVLYDFPIKGGGSGTYVKYLATTHQASGAYNIAIALPDREKIDNSIKQYNIKLPQIPIFIGRPGLENSKRYTDLTAKEIADLYYAYLKETIKIVEDFKPDIIHVHHMLINAWVADFIRGVYGIKYVITSHGSDLYAISQDRRYFRKSREALRAADTITVVSADTREKLLRMFGKELAHKTRTIPGGIRVLQFRNLPKDEILKELREKYRLEDNNIVLFTGRLISEKGVEYLVKAAGRIKGQVVIAGEGPQKKHLQELVEGMKLKNVRLTGYIDHDTLVKLYYLADVFVSPSVWDDPMPLAVIEAMASGLPVVITRKGGMSIAVKDGINGYFVRTRNSTDIAEKVNKLLENRDLRSKMGERGKSVAMNKFTWKMIANKFHKIYTKM